MGRLVVRRNASSPLRGSRHVYREVWRGVMFGARRWIDSRLAIVRLMLSRGMKMRQRSLMVRNRTVPTAHSRICIRSKGIPRNPVVLLITGDRALIESTTRSCKHESLTLDCVDRLSDVTAQQKSPHVVQALVADLSQFDKRELEALRVLMGAAPKLPVIALGNDDDVLIRHAGLLAQGAQDLLLKSHLDGRGFGRAVRIAMARKSTRSQHVQS
jgi:hypothetical protein